MHYPLHITLVFAGLSILRDDVNAAKTGLSAEVLTSFAKNVASVLSTTLLNNYHEPQTNQTSFTLLKKFHDPQSTFSLHSSQSEDSDNSPTVNSNRFARQGEPPNGQKEAYPNPYIIDQLQYGKYDNSEAYKPYPYNFNPDVRANYDHINVAAPENINNGANRNSIEADIKAAPLPYTGQYNYPRRLAYRRGPVNSLPNQNPYPPFVVQPQRQFLPSDIPSNRAEYPARTDPLNPNEVESDNVQAARITRRPFNLNYPIPIPGLYNPSLPTQSGFYPNDRPTEGEGQTVSPINDEDQNNPSRIVADQNQGQTAFGIYGYGPGFHYKPPYYGGFYDGYPGFYPGPFNGSFPQGNPELDASNGTAGPYPYGPPAFYDPKFGPYYPYSQPFYPNFHGQARPAEPQNPESQGYKEQGPAPENGNGHVNGTGYGPPFGFPYGPPYGPYYGGHSGYPLVPFNGFPYRFGPGFHDHLYPRIKVGPYLNFYPGHYHAFPLLPFYPYGGYHPYYNNNKPMGMPEKPEETDKVIDENADAGAPPANGDVEMLAESKSDATRAMPANVAAKRNSPMFVAKEKSNATRDRDFDRSP